MKKCNHYGNLIGSLTLLSGTAAMALSGCSGKPAEKPPTQEQVYGQRIGRVLQLAGELGVKERHLMAAGYVGGYFGLTDGQKNQRWLAESGRSPSLGLDLRKNPELRQLGFRAQMDVLARDIQDRAERQQPTNDFDWLALIAQAMAGDFEPDPNIRSLQIRMVLMELIEASNAGFSAALNEREVYTLPPAGDEERIDLRLLDPGQLRLINGNRFPTDGLADLFVEGNAKARTGANITAGKAPKLVLRLCPSTALLCFDALRKTSTMGAHFLSYKALNGTRETVQFHDPKFELSWFEKPQPDTITLMIAGTTGATRETSRTELFDWEDYVALRSVIRRAAGRLTQDIMTDNPSAVQREFIRSSVQETLGMLDENAEPPQFPLGATWDSDLFRELLASEMTPKQTSQIKVEQPIHGQTIAGTVIEGVVFPDEESGQIQVYQDSPEASGNGTPWELVLKRDLDPRQRRFPFSHEIRRIGLNGNQLRALKFVSRRSDGSLLGSRIVRLKVEGIARP
ncbi:MAG: hypothetical protein RIR26_2256 [Pseudomonadota bacterium]